MAGAAAMTAGHPVARGAAAWLVLFAVAQAATLQMVRAGNLIGYQHYTPLVRLIYDTPPLVLAILAGQALAVAWGLARARLAILEALGPAGRGWRLAAVTALFVLTSATLSRRPGTYASELLLASFVQLVHLGNVVLFAHALGGDALDGFGRAMHRLLGPRTGDAAEPGGPDRFAWVLAAWVTIVAAALAVFAYQRHPHVPDEVVYLIHARYFAAGMLTLPLPPVPDAFNVDLMTYQAARWFCPVPIGWPAMLALGALVGAPWLVNPVLGGVNVVLAYVALREVYPRRTARLALVLFAASPWNLFMAMNFMTHTFTLTCALAAAAAVGRMRRDPRLRWGVLGGMAIGMVSLIRPLEGFASAGLLGLWSLGSRGTRWRFAPSAALTIATIVTGALTLPYNRYLTGSARVFPIMAYTDAAYGAGTNALGFGANRGLGWPGLDPFPGHGPVDVLVNANLNLFQINVELLGWATGSLLVIALLVFGGRLRRGDRLMIAAIAAVAGIHSFYWFSGGPDFGARYWYLVIVPCVALAARGVEELEVAAERASNGGPRVLAGAAALIAVTLAVFVPWRATDKYYHYRGMRPDIRRLARERHFGDVIVLVRGCRHPDYASAAAYNPLDLRVHTTLYAWDRGPGVREELIRAYPGRAFWIVNGPTISGRGFEAAAGPLTAEQLRARVDAEPRARCAGD